MSSRQVVYMVELVGQLEAGREVPRERKAVIIFQENGEKIGRAHV